MSQPLAASSPQKGTFKTSTLVLIAFGTAFVSRLFDAVGFPSTVNFVHLVAVPYACGLSVLKARARDPKQIFASQSILIGLMILLGVITASALINEAGIINVIVDYLLLGEPFLLLLAIICIPMSVERIEWFRTWILRLAFLNLALGIIQGPILRLHLRNPDYVKGIFIGQGAGHVVGASVSLTFGVYYFITARQPLWIRAGVAFATFVHMIFADAKQVLVIFMVSGLLLLLTKLKDVVQFIKLLVFGIVFGIIFIWCIQNVPAFDAFNTWLRPEIYGPEGEATLLKTASIRIIPQYYTSDLNVLFGLGPGHTIGRLGGWMLREYQDLLMPLGATTHPASNAIWVAVGKSWLGSQSSFFSPLFGWAGIWGDLGFLGLATYLGLAYVVWKYLCIEDISRFFLLNIFVFGLVFSQMEEPGYMLFVAILIGLRWHEQHILKI